MKGYINLLGGILVVLAAIILLLSAVCLFSSETSNFFELIFNKVIDNGNDFINSIKESILE